MISPDQLDRLHDQDDLFTAILFAGCLLFFVGGALAIFAVQDFASGTNFMQRLAGAEQALGFLLIAVGWIKVHSIKKELERNAPAQPASKTAAARAGE
jgi:hypothetical protein